MSNRAYIIDLIHSIGEKLALADHLAEKLEEQKIQELYAKVVEERRNEMRLLVKLAPNANLEYWCAFKHALKSWCLALEVYDYAKTEENLNVAQYNEDILAEITCLFLGLEPKPCARCLDDVLNDNYNKSI